MEIKQILKDIESSFWWTEECPGHLGLCMDFMDGFAGVRNQIDVPFHSLSVLLLEQGKIREETKADEKSRIFLWILEEMKKDRKIVNKLFRRQREIEKKLAGLSKKLEKTDLKSMENRRLWEKFKEFYDLMVLFCEIAVIPEGGDPFVEDYLLPRLKKTDRIPESEINEVMIVFSTPVIYSFMDNEHIDFLKLCISYLKDSKNIFSAKLKKHSDDYFWIRNNFSGPYPLDKRYFLERVKEETKNKTEKDLKKDIERVKKDKEEFRKKKTMYAKRYKLSSETKLIFKIYEEMGVWIDDRKRRIVISVHYQALLLNEIARRNSMDWLEINYYTIPEIKGLLLNNKKISKDELKSRFECSAYITTKDERFLVTGDDAKKIVEAFDRKIKTEIVKGIVANKAKGKVVGEVCIVIDPHKDKFPEGKILVTTMTRPDFVHLIKKAKAIITDEGGITSHAAVVNREFGIPCIIGTKNGTRMLKTGDRVEVDTENGVVKILKSADKDDKEPELRPEFIRRMKRIKKQKGIRFKSVDELRKHYEKS